jgi:4'-phosphopantetheinyl transferase
VTGFLLRRQSQVPDGDGWLTATERRWLTDRRSAKRVADWRLGRWTAKAAIGAFLDVRGQPPGDSVEVLAAADGAPQAFAGGRPLPLALSLSHSHGRALAVVAVANTALGCDLERIEPRSEAFVASYLTPAERAALAATDGARRDLFANLLWSAKESALKALRQGLRADTRSLQVAVKPSSGHCWERLEIAAESAGSALEGRWMELDGFVVTVVSRPAPTEMVELG